MTIQETDIASFDGTRLRCWTVGAGRPLVVVNPPGIHPKFWLPLAERLDGRFSLVLWQARGMWDSAMPDDPAAVTVSDYAGDLRAIIAALGIEQFDLLAYCSGVFAACEVLKDPSFVPGKVLFVGTPLRLTPPGSFINQLIQRAKKRPFAREMLFSFVFEFAPPQLRGDLEAALQEEARLYAFLTTAQSMYDYEIPLQFGRSLPLRLVVAERDLPHIKESNSIYFEKRGCPDDTLLEVPGSHFFIMEQPEVADDVITGYLQRGTS